MEFREKLKSKFAAYNIDLDDKQCRLFYTYYKLIVETNEKFNLTSITDEDEVIEKHFLDSALLFTYLKRIFGEGAFNMIDIGTGAGLPGIVLKILLPNIKLTLVDSVLKKAEFLKTVINELQFNNTEALHVRAEDLAAKSEYRECFDAAVSRAVASLNTLSEYCLPFVKTGGIFAAYKSAKTEEEIILAKNAIKILGGKINAIKQFEIEGQKRSLIIIDKINRCDKKYPRGGNKPRLQPL